MGIVIIVSKKMSYFNDFWNSYILMFKKDVNFNGMRYSLFSDNMVYGSLHFRCTFWISCFSIISHKFRHKWKQLVA